MTFGFSLRVFTNFKNQVEDIFHLRYSRVHPVWIAILSRVQEYSISFRTAYCILTFQLEGVDVLGVVSVIHWVDASRPFLEIHFIWYIGHYLNHTQGQIKGFHKLRRFQHQNDKFHVREQMTSQTAVKGYNRSKDGIHEWPDHQVP